MEVRIRADSVEIEGYVNAVERKSKPLRSRIGKFIEKISKGAFQRALTRNDDVRLLLNHNWNRDLGGTKDGTLELHEDNIGLHARAVVTDKEVIEKARNNDLVGWSFGFTDVDVDPGSENGVIVRNVNDLDLQEVSILDRSKVPAYDGTLLNVRSDDNCVYYGEAMLADVNTSVDEPPKQEEPPKPIDYSKYETMIREMKEGAYSV